MMTTIRNGLHERRKRMRARFFARIREMEIEIAAMKRAEAQQEQYFAALDTRKGDLAVTVYLACLGLCLLACLYLNLSR